MSIVLVLCLSSALAADPVVASDAVEESEDAASSEDSTAAAVIGALTRGQQDDRAARIEQFLEEVIWFQNVGYFTTTGVHVGSASYPKRGKYGEVLSTREFYEAVGRDDLSTELKKKRLVNGLVNLGAFGALVTGTVQLVRGAMMTDDNTCWTLYDSENPTPEALCEASAAQAAADARRPLYTQAGVLGGVALGGFVAVGFNRPTRVEPHEQRGMADAHNKQRLGELGLTEDDLESLSARRGLSGELSPWFGPSGGGARLDVQF